jgi:hypothetical protein
VAPPASTAMPTLVPTTTPRLRRGSFAAGAVAAATLVAIGWMPGAGGTLGLDVRVEATPTGELAVSPAGPVASAAGLRPGQGELRGRVTLLSQVGRAMTVRVRQRPSLGDADDALRVQLSSGGRVIYDGTAGGLRRPTRTRLSIAARGSAALDVRAWLPAHAPGGWSGRSVTLPLEYAVSIGGKRRR